MGLLDSFKKYSHGHWDHGNESPGLSSEQRHQMGPSQQGDGEAQFHVGAAHYLEARSVVRNGKARDGVQCLHVVCQLVRRKPWSC